MAKQRMVNTKFWDDGYIRSLEPNGKLLFLYLFTGPLATISGAYEITIAHAEFHTGIPADEIGIWLEKFRTDDKATFIDGWLLVHNTIDHQTLTSPKIVSGIEESVKSCPDWIKHTLSVRYQRLSHLNPNLNSNLNPNSKNGTAAIAAVETPVERRIWKDGIDLLAKSAMTEKQARPLLGRLAKDYGNEMLAECIAVTQAQNPADPRPFLIGALRKRCGATDRVKLQVGKDNGDEPAYNCPLCFDTGEISRKPEGAEFDWQLEYVPCKCRVRIAV